SIRQGFLDEAICSLKRFCDSKYKSIHRRDAEDAEGAQRKACILSHNEFASTRSLKKLSGPELRFIALWGLACLNRHISNVCVRNYCCVAFRFDAKCLCPWITAESASNVDTAWIFWLPMRWL